MTWRGVFPFLAQALPMLTFFSALAMRLSRLNLPSAEFWQGKTPWVLGALIGASLPGAVQAFLLERGERRRRKELEQEEKIRVILTASLVDLATNCGVDWGTVGVRAFATKRKWRPFKSIHRHDKIGVVKLNSGPASGIKWIDGKGIVGRCWATKGERQFDNFGRFSSYRNSTWTTLSPKDRYELTFDELTLMRERYGVVAAVPIVKGTEYLGCITMDTEPAPASIPDKAQVWRSLGVTAALVKGVLDQ